MSVATIFTNTSALRTNDEAPATAAELIRVACLFALTLAIWLIARPYRGIQHDSMLYALQALAHANPARYSSDIFLAYGSQDQFTLFTPAFSWFINAVGLERAGVLASFFFQLLLAAGTFCLARIFANLRVAALATALVLIVPNYYGGRSIFEVTEPFVSARIAAECLTVFALASYLHQRRLLAYLLAAAAMTLHPLMGLPGLLLLILMDLPSNLTRWAVFAGLACVAATYVLAWAAPFPHVAFMTPQWLEVVQARSGHLFVDRWRVADWQRVALHVSALLFACRFVDDAVRKNMLEKAVLLSLLGLILASTASIFRPVEILIQGQPWRWDWLAALLTIVATPWLAIQLWDQKTVGRASAILLMLALILPARLGVLAPVSLICWIYRDRLSEKAGKLLLAASWMLVAILAAEGLANSIDSGSRSFTFDTEPVLLERLRDIISLGIAAPAITLLAWHQFLRKDQRVVALPLGLLACAFVAWYLPRAWQSWTSEELFYGPRQMKLYAAWRAEIPEGSQVLWALDARAAWFLLQRPSYLSRSQSAGVVFNEATANEVLVRAVAVDPYVTKDFMLTLSREKTDIADLTPAVLDRVCQAPALDFIVGKDAGAEGYRLPVPDPNRPNLELYDCRARKRHR